MHANPRVRVLAQFLQTRNCQAPSDAEPPKALEQFAEIFVRLPTSWVGMREHPIQLNFRRTGMAALASAPFVRGPRLRLANQPVFVIILPGLDGLNEGGTAAFPSVPSEPRTPAAAAEASVRRDREKRDGI